FGVAGMRLLLRVRYDDCFGRGCSPFEVQFVDSALRTRVLLLVVAGE
ncbi:hypothetical protein A2U01_0084777, partial [Trifolium medium]|nr:hypothetical protein [Trifolium medium]